MNLHYYLEHSYNHNKSNNNNHLNRLDQRSVSISIDMDGHEALGLAEVSMAVQPALGYDYVGLTRFRQIVNWKMRYEQALRHRYKTSSQ